MVNWPEPQTVKRFLGFGNFNRRNCSSVVAPLTSVKRVPKRLCWNDGADLAFRKLKSMFASAPVLKHPDSDLPFIVEVDVSSSPEWEPFSPSAMVSPPSYTDVLSSQSRTYDVGNQELLAVKLCFEE